LYKHYTAQRYLQTGDLAEAEICYPQVLELVGLCSDSGAAICYMMNVRSWGRLDVQRRGGGAR